MERILNKDLKNHIGEQVMIKGWLDSKRDHGKIAFLIMRDRSAFVQVVVKKADELAFEIAKKARPEWVLEIIGEVQERSEAMRNPDELNGDIEIVAKEIKVLSTAQELPFEKEEELNIETHLTHLPFTLRSKKARAIFKIQSGILEAYRSFLRQSEFVEFTAPAIVGGDAEGGAGVFKVDYFKDKTAYLATSPQLYKQIMVGVFERVFSTGKVFRAEKHATTRHLSEYYSLDFEMGFIDSHEDIMNQLEKTIRAIVTHIQKNNQEDLGVLEAPEIALPEQSFPVIKMREAQELIKQKTGKDKTSEPDLEPEDERFLCQWAKEEFGSDFIFVTHYPTLKRPFYTYKDEDDPEYTKSFDLLFKGVEIATGGQRVHDYDTLISQLKEKNLEPEKFAFYLEAFKYGMPPHGGVGMGLERLTAKIANLANVKESALFPRDMTRIDLPLSLNQYDEN